MDTNSSILTVYSLIWIVWLVVYQKKTRVFTIGTLILGIYSLSSLASIYFYFNMPSLWTEHLSPWAFLYLTVCMVICVYPFVSKSKELQESTFLFQKSGFIQFFLILSTPFILDCLLEVTKVAMNTNVVSLADVYGETSRDVVGEQLSAIGSKTLAYVRMFTYIWPVLVFYCLASDNRRFRYLSIVPLAAFAAICVAAYASGHRVTIVRQVLFFVIMYLLFYKSLDKKLTRYLNFSLLAGSIVVVVLLFFITVSRFDSYDFDFDVMTFVAWYAGEGEIRFAQHLWDLTRTSDGDTCFALVKDFFGMHTYTDLDMRRYVYYQHLCIPTNIFYTFIGDWYIDFGPWITPLLCLVFSGTSYVFLSYVIRKEFITILNSTCVAILGTIVSFGITYFSFKTAGDQKTLLMGIGWILFFMLVNYVTNYSPEEIVESEEHSLAEVESSDQQLPSK